MNLTFAEVAVCYNKPSQAKPSQAKPKPSQAKPSQAKPSRHSCLKRTAAAFTATVLLTACGGDETTVFIRSGTTEEQIIATQELLERHRAGFEAAAAATVSDAFVADGDIVTAQVITDRDGEPFLKVLVNEPFPTFPPQPVFPVSGGDRANLYLFSPFEIELDDGTNFYTGGFWLLDLSGADDFRAGIFIDDGASEWPATAVAALSGSASYTGDAAGLYLGTDDSGQFEGTAAFAANFGTGTLTGTVRNIRDHLTGKLITPDLNFGGNRGVIGGSLVGTWDYEYSSRILELEPDAVSGVFNAANKNGTMYMIGAFGAQRDP